MDGQRRDFEYISIVRKEVGKLVEPVSSICYQNKNHLQLLNDKITEHMIRYEKYTEWVRRKFKDYTLYEDTQRKVSAVSGFLSETASLLQTEISMVNKECHKL